MTVISRYKIEMASVIKETQWIRERKRRLHNYFKESVFGSFASCGKGSKNRIENVKR